MPAFRRHRLRIRLSLFAMLALLWSQLAFAAHAPCMDDEHAHAVIEVVTTDCGHEMPPPQEPVCAVHCSQGEMTADAVRTLSVPPLPFLPLTFLPRIRVVIAVRLPTAEHGDRGGNRPLVGYLDTPPRIQ